MHSSHCAQDNLDLCIIASPSCAIMHGIPFYRNITYCRECAAFDVSDLASDLQDRSAVLAVTNSFIGEITVALLKELQCAC